MKEQQIPDRRGGGTFVYDKDGKLLEHTPPTKTVEQAKAEAAAAAETESADAATSTALTEDAPPVRTSRRGRTGSEE